MIFILNDYDKKVYKVARILIAILTCVVFRIMMINEDSSWNFIPFLFAVIGYFASIPGTNVSKKIINFGDSVTNILLRILYYALILPVGMFILFFCTYYLIAEIALEVIDVDLGGALIGLGLIAACTIFIVVPYVLSIMYLIARIFVKEN